MGALTRLFLTFTVFALLAIAPDVAEAGAPNCDDNPGHPKCGGDGGGGGGGGGGGSVNGTLYNWMHSDLLSAWNAGYGGQGVTITFVDDFSSGYVFSGTLTGEPCLGTKSCAAQTHGQWTSLQGELMAPLANIVQDDWNGNRVRLKKGFNVLNLSYGQYAAPGFSMIIWGGQERSILSFAANGDAVVAKAAGNGCGAATGQEADKCGDGGTTGLLDYLARDLIGDPGTLFVGALEDHGTIGTGELGTGMMAYYSNVAGSNLTVQSQFLVVGVDASDMGFAGTSFAAPQVASYAAIVSSKFTAATPTLVVDQLLETALTDTILNYDPSIHGQGEASLANALAPVSIN